MIFGNSNATMVYSSIRKSYIQVQVLTEQPIYYYNLHIPSAQHRYADKSSCRKQDRNYMYCNLILSAFNRHMNPQRLQLQIPMPRSLHLFFQQRMFDA